MPNIVIIEKNGDMKNMNIKSFAASDLFKKAGFKTPANFDCHTVWNIQYNNKDYSIELHAKNTGRANQENKYEFPPPVDKILFFGSCVLINRKTPSEIDDLYVNDWKNICETLFGGFEDLNEEESEDEACEIEEEREAAKNNKLTKTGYLDDGFVVEDDNDSEESFGDDEENDDENDDEDKPITIPLQSKRRRKLPSIRPTSEALNKNIVIELSVSKTSPGFNKSTSGKSLNLSSPSLRSGEALNLSKRKANKSTADSHEKEVEIAPTNEFVEMECRKKKTISKSKNTNKKNANKKDDDQKSDIDIYLNCENELVEEDYV
jgi:hypothetical protein